MVVSAAHFKDITNGYERRTDGLWVHSGRLIVRGGPVDLPVGSIDTAELAPNAVHGLLYEAVFTGNGVGVAATGGWQAVSQFMTPSVACSGASVVAEYSITFSSDAPAGWGHYVGVGLDGTAHAHYFHHNSGGMMNHSASHRFAPSAGNHIFGLFVLSGTGTWAVWSGGYQCIRLWEVKK